MGSSEEKEPNVEHIIIAPHCDDEIIGTFEVLKRNPHVTIMYDGNTPQERRDEALKLREKLPHCKQIFQKAIPQPFMRRINKFYFPDPVYETHPFHRQWGMVGELYARDGYDVTFYSTNMRAPYVHEVRAPEEKLDWLMFAYRSQSDLWKYDHRYFLFEGKCKWIF